MSAPATTPASFFLRHEFAIRRLHSLLGIVPLGLYMVVHLTTNASLLNAPETFQRAVYLIHSPGKLLPLIEWGFIFAPLVFHAVLGVWIAKTGKIQPRELPIRRQQTLHLAAVDGIHRAGLFVFSHPAPSRLVPCRPLVGCGRATRIRGIPSV